MKQKGIFIKILLTLPRKCQYSTNIINIAKTSNNYAGGEKLRRFTFVHYIYVGSSDRVQMPVGSSDLGSSDMPCFCFDLFKRIQSISTHFNLKRHPNFRFCSANPFM